MKYFFKYSFSIFLFCLSIISSEIKAQANNCGGAIAITANTTCINTAYQIKKTWDVQTGGNAPSSCASGWDHDGWFSVTVPAGVTSLTLTATTDKDLALGLFSGSCGSLAQVTCTNGAGNGGQEKLVASVTAGQTYYINLAHNGNTASAGNICVTYNNSAPSNDQCSGAAAVTCGNSYTGSTALSTSTGDPSGTCGTSSGAPGLWFQITGNGNAITASLCGSNFDTKIQVFTGACGGAQTCVVGNDDYCSLQSQVTWASTNGVTYYIFVGGYSGATGNYSLNISCAIPLPPNCSVYTAPTNGALLNCVSTNLTWNAPVGGGAPTQYLLYFGTDPAATNINNGTNIGNVLSYSPTGLLPNTTYYWKILPQNGAGTATCTTTFSFTTGGASIANDLCGGAIPLTSGVTINDDNTCAGAETNLAAASCWSSGAVNSLWYSVNVTNGTLGVLTTSISLVNTQIAVYNGSCAGTLSEVACNDDAPGAGCSATSTSNSQLNLTGLTNGLYYIRVDGRNNNVGTYNIMATTTGSVGTANPIPGQDCSSPQVLCANPLNVGDPGYANTGNVCDWSGYGNCTSGEKNGLWIQFSIQTGGNLLFNIVPNDFNSADCGGETDYDWVLYKMSGSGSTTCSNISSTSGDGEAACNFSYLGVTGMSATGNQPPNGTLPSNPSAGCYDASYEPTITTVAGEIYYLVIQNYSGSTKGFRLDFPGGGAIPNLTTPTQVLWTGGANTTSVSTQANWGGCAIPTCAGAGVDAIIAPSASSQPVVSVNTAVKSLTINPGATLTINANIRLDVCGDFVNNGTLICAAGSTVNFNGTGTQIVAGNLTGTNKFSNFMVTKTSGTVSLLSNIEAGQNIITSNATSIVNTNGVDIYLGGNFLNSHGGTTFTGIGSTSTFFFNGTTAQVYNPNMNAATPNLILNNVTMNHSGAGVTISTTNTPDMYLGPSGVLSLIAGKIITPGAQEVEVQNTANAAVSTGNTSSFVQGNLRRYLAAGATGSFDFPVGNIISATSYYERANINFTSAAAAGAIQLVARFDPWGGSWPLPGAPGWSECTITYNMPYLNNGYWSIDASSPSTGLYDLTLYNLGYSNAYLNYSIAKSPSAAPAWALNGTCSMPSPVTAVVRTGMSGFSKMATVQSDMVLAVDLLDFYGFQKGNYNEIFWRSAAETNFKNYELESSEDGVNFHKIATLNPLGNKTTTNQYSYPDFNFYSPISYYRLKMNDLDGQYSFSHIIDLTLNNQLNGTVSVFPNPATDEIGITVNSADETTAIIQIKDIIGRVLYSQDLFMKSDSEKILINTGHFADGTYIVSVNYPNSPPENIKVIINKK